MTARDLAATEFDPKNLAQGIAGCDAVFPFDPEQAYEGLKRWLAALERQLQQAQEVSERIKRDGVGTYRECARSLQQEKARAGRLEDALRKIARYNVATRQAMELRRIAHEALAAAGADTP